MLAGLGLEIRAIRDSLGETQQQFAHRLDDVAISSVQKWEAGKVRPNRRTLGQIRALGAAFAEAAKPRRRRYSEQAIMDCHTAVDLILDNAASEVVKKLQEFLGKHAAQWRER